jgi:putative hydrolase of the HAD superfamily
MPINITHLFLDIGGVLLTNGWDRYMRVEAAKKFGLDLGELNDRHKQSFSTYELGKLTLDTYLNQVVFCRERSFSREEFKEFMFAQSKPHYEMIELVRQLKAKYNLWTAAISNEGRELTVYRIKKFNLKSIIDFFVSSCFVHFRKPDFDIYTMALDVSQAVPEQSVYIDDRPLFAEIARDMGIRGIHHASLDATKVELAKLGLTV